MVLQRLQLFPAQLMVAEACLFGDLQKPCWDLRFGPPGQPADMVIQRDRAAIAGALRMLNSSARQISSAAAAARIGQR